MNLQSRLERIETAPIMNLIRERREWRRIEIEKFRASIQEDIDGLMEIAEYCGLPSLPAIRADIESDTIEQELLAFAEYTELFANAERTDERAIEAITKSDMKFFQEIYGREFSPDDLAAARERGDRARADLAAGIPASESEAAREIVLAEPMRAARLKRHTDAYADYIAGLDSRIPDCEFTG